MIVASTARDTRDLASNICSCCNYLRRRHVRRVTGLLRIRGVTYGEEVACLRHDKGSSMQDGRAQIMLRQSCHDLGARRGKTSLNRTGQEDDTRSPRLRQRGQKANALPACNDRSRVLLIVAATHGRPRVCMLLYIRVYAPSRENCALSSDDDVPRPFFAQAHYATIA